MASSSSAWRPRPSIASCSAGGSTRYFPRELNLTENLVEVLRKANEFVPSSAGSILLDDPSQKRKERRAN